ncbi:MAG: hypothetical protein QE271_06790 [Bacteriovoracaceae bacterium]|nr:hypothetical protein [Bacteriovoracaceae bacterium]
MQKIRVVAVNLFPFSSYSLREKILLGCKIPKTEKSFSCLKISGSDSSQFLQGQTTQDVFLYKNAPIKRPLENAVLDGGGRLQVTFSQWEDSPNVWYLIVDSKMKRSLEERLLSYIISEDVEIEDVNTEETHEAVFGIFSYQLEASQGQLKSIPFSFLGASGNLIPYSKASIFPKLTESEFKMFLMLQGSFVNEAMMPAVELFTNTVYSEMSLSLTKGCFLGQETVAKIVSRRGAAHYPTLLATDVPQDFDNLTKLSFQNLDLKILGQGKFEEKFYLLVDMPREMRIPNNKILAQVEASFNKKYEQPFETIFAPFFPYQINSLIDDTYFLLLKLAAESKDSRHDESKELAALGLEIFISQNPTYLDAYEMQGVLLTQLKKYPEAIDCFKKLNEIDPNSVMACVNLSRIYGELGEIQLAEDYKAEGIVRSFQLNALGLEKENPIPSPTIHDPAKIQMFLDVLEIDPDDRFAKNQLSQIFCEQKDWKKLEQLLEGLDPWQLVKTDPEFTLPLFELNKNLYQDPHAKQILLKGIESAAKLGKQKLISEIQATLQLLASNSP